jgi:hypothetical protein
MIISAARQIAVLIVALLCEAELRRSAEMDTERLALLESTFTGRALTAPGPQHIEPPGEMVDGLLGRPALAVEQHCDQDSGGSEPEDR